MADHPGKDREKDGDWATLRQVVEPVECRIHPIEADRIWLEKAPTKLGTPINSAETAGRLEQVFAVPRDC